MRRNILLIHNPVAGRRNGALLKAVEQALAGFGCAATRRQTAAAGDARSFAQAAAGGGWDAIAAAGGDGTVNEIINGLGANSPPLGQIPLGQIPLGLVPLGTANVLAAEIGLGNDPRRIAETLVFGPAISITPGQAGQKRFALMASVGFDARAVAAVTPVLKRALGKGAYALEALRQLLAPGPLPVYDVTIDGAGYRAGWVIVANAKHYAGGFVAAPAADIGEPGFQVCLIAGRRRHILMAALAMARGRPHRSPAVRIVAGRRITLAGRPGDPVQMDGENAAVLPLTVEPAPETMTVIVPADRAP